MLPGPVYVGLGALGPEDGPDLLAVAGGVGRHAEGERLLDVGPQPDILQDGGRGDLAVQRVKVNAGSVARDEQVLRNSMPSVFLQP